MKNGGVPFTGELLQDSTKKLPVIETPNSNIPPPIANFASGAARPLYHPSSFPSPTTSVDVVRKILIEVVDNPENALALVQAIRKRHGQEIFELQIKRKNDSTEEQISKVVKVMNDDEN
jgi:Na+/serine symporter